MPERAALVVVFVVVLTAVTTAEWCPSDGESGLAFSTNGFVLASGGETDLLANRSIYWLHVPKAGTSIFNTLFHRCYPDGANVSLAKGRMAVHFTRHIPKMRLHSECEVVVRVHRPYLASLGSDGDGCPFWVAMLREPSRRLRSAFVSGGHCYGLGGSEAKAVHAIATLAEFARHPSIEGCQTRMVSGAGACASNRRPANARMARQAVDVLRSRFAFIGLTDRWDESVCLFYAMYGGSAAASDFYNQRPSRPTRLVTDAELADIADADANDRFVFDYARRWFEEQLAVHRAAVDRCLHTAAQQQSTDGQSLPSAQLLDPLFDSQQFVDDFQDGEDDERSEDERRDDERSDDERSEDERKDDERSDDERRDDERSEDERSEDERRDDERSEEDKTKKHLADLLERVESELAEEHTVQVQLHDKLHSDTAPADSDEQHMQQLEERLQRVLVESGHR